MEADRIKWDRKYQGEEYFFSLTPSRFLSERLAWVKRVLPGRRALDIACGEGRNSIFLAREGFLVTGIDISGEGLSRAMRRASQEGVQVEFVQADLEGYVITGSYDLIINFNFLLRPLIPAAVACLAPGGVLVLETIMDAPNLEAGHTREFLLQPGELERLLAPLPGKLHFLEELPGERIPVARALFQKEPV